MSRRRGGERGAALVEFAIIVPLLIVLVLGVADFGFAFNDQLELRSASREGARLAAVDNGCATNRSCPSADAQRDALIATTRARATGLAVSSRIRVSVTYSGSRVGIDVVTMCLNYPLRSATGVFPFLNGTLLKSKAVMRLEQVPTFSQGSDTGGPGTATC